MSEIQVLDQGTIDKIAAGEVVERPSSIAKELVENALDAGATRITVEIRDGGIRLLRITDNGKGIPGDEVRLAFLRHATSKLRTVGDFGTLRTLGFRGEALSSIAAVSRVEMVTRRAGELTGTRICIEGGRERLFEEVGAPEGTTILVRDIFYNTPARGKFLKTAQTEAAHVGNFVEMLALAKPDVAFEFITNGESKLVTTGSGKLRDVIYHIYGKEAASELLTLDTGDADLHLGGVIARPAICRGNRNFENYFVNGRYVKSRLLSAAIEEGYGTMLMKHMYPFTCIFLDIKGTNVDVNVHPTKMEVRFSNEKGVYNAVKTAVENALKGQEMVIHQTLVRDKTTSGKGKRYENPAPFEQEAIREREAVYAKTVSGVSPAGNADRPQPVSETLSWRRRMDGQNPLVVSEKQRTDGQHPLGAFEKQHTDGQNPLVGFEEKHLEGMDLPGVFGEPDQSVRGTVSANPSDGTFARERAEEKIREAEGTFARERAEEKIREAEEAFAKGTPSSTDSSAAFYEQQELVPGMLSPKARTRRRILGCAFKTYWIVEYGEELFLIDQHAAHEKVLYERFTKMYRDAAITQQLLNPPIIFSATLEEKNLLEEYGEAFAAAGFEIEPFGGREYKVSAVPYHLSMLGSRELFTEMLDHLETSRDPKKLQVYILRIATEACKAAVKGGDVLSLPEAEALFDELFLCEDPYHCPHGRPTVISFTEKELEKRFKRIV